MAIVNMDFWLWVVLNHSLQRAIRIEINQAGQCFPSINIYGPCNAKGRAKLWVVAVRDLSLEGECSLSLTSIRSRLKIGPSTILDGSKKSKWRVLRNEPWLTWAHGIVYLGSHIQVCSVLTHLLDSIDGIALIKLIRFHTHLKRSS